MCVFLPLIPVKPTRHIYSLFLPSLPTYATAFAFCRLTRYALCVKRDAPPSPPVPPLKKSCAVSMSVVACAGGEEVVTFGVCVYIRATYDTKHEDRIALLFHLSPPPPSPSRSGAIHTAPPPSPLTLVGRGARGEERKSPVSRRVYLIIYFPSFSLPPPLPLLPWSRERKGGSAAEAQAIPGTPSLPP